MRKTLATCSSKAMFTAASVWSIPMNLGQPLLGPDKTPALLHAAGLSKLLHTCGWRVVTQPVLNPGPSSRDNDALNAKNCEQIGKSCKMIRDTMLNHLSKNDDFSLILGGDHCIPIGTLPALMKLRPSTGIVWVDAHADINTPQISSSGNVHGMPVAFLMGLVEKVQELPSFDWFTPCITPKDIVYIGLRDLDAGEKQLIRKLGIKAFTMHDVDRYGIGAIMDKTNEYFKDKKHIHLSYDIDALDPFFAPHTGTAVRGGLTFREGNYICEALYETNKLSSMELVEVNPSVNSEMYQNSNDTIEMAMTLIGSAMGQRIL